MMVGCSKDQVVSEMPQDNAINFGMYFGRDAQSRAAITDLNDLKARGFGVFAYYTDNSDYVEGTSTPNFMFNQFVRWDGSAWVYSPLKYWPNDADDRLSFFAYAAHSLNGNVSVATGFNKNTASAPAVKYTLANDLTDHVDLMWATPVMNQTNQAIAGNVKFTFNHALSRIGFKAVAVIDEINGENTGDVDNTDPHGKEVAPGTTITIDEIVLTGDFHKGGTLSLIDGAWAKDDLATKTYTWGAGKLITDHTVTKTKAMVINDDSYLTVVPQSADSNKDLKIKVTYTVTTQDAALAGGKSVVQSTVESDAFDFEFKQGYAYNFVLHIGLTSVKFDAEVSAWALGTDEDIVVNVPLND
jgi:hypothetical protein